MLSLLLYHYDCLLFYHSFCPDSTNFCFSHAFQNAILKTGCLDQNRKPQYVPSRLIPTSKILKKTEREVFPLKKIASFTIDHIKLQPGIYVSRKDHIGADTITTFYLRMTSPNEEPVMNTALARWYVAPVFICFSQEIMNPKTSSLWSQKCLPLSAISTMKYLGHHQKTAAIIWI